MIRSRFALVFAAGLAGLAAALPAGAQPAAAPAVAASADALAAAGARLADAVAVSSREGIVAALGGMADLATERGLAATATTLSSFAAAFGAMDAAAIVAGARAVLATGGDVAEAAVAATAPLVEMIQLAIPGRPPALGREWVQLAVNPDPARPFVDVTLGIATWALVQGAAVSAAFALPDAELAGDMAFTKAVGPGGGAAGVNVVVTLQGPLAGQVSATRITAGDALTPAHVAYAATAGAEGTFTAFIPGAEVAALPDTPAFGIALTLADGAAVWLRIATGTTGSAALAVALRAWGG